MLQIVVLMFNIFVLERESNEKEIGKKVCGKGHVIKFNNSNQVRQCLPPSMSLMELYNLEFLSSQQHQ